MLYYKDDFTDFCMHHNMSMPRYRHLARKLLHHYLGDQYNPETLDPDIELQFREGVHVWVRFKVIMKAPYDWNYIDNAFRHFLNEASFKHITYDEELCKKDYHDEKYSLMKLPKG